MKSKLREIIKDSKEKIKIDNIMFHDFIKIGSKCSLED